MLENIFRKLLCWFWSVMKKMVFVEQTINLSKDKTKMEGKKVKIIRNEIKGIRFIKSERTLKDLRKTLNLAPNEIFQLDGYMIEEEENYYLKGEESFVICTGYDVIVGNKSMPDEEKAQLCYTQMLETIEWKVKNRQELSALEFQHLTYLDETQQKAAKEMNEFNWKETLALAKENYLYTAGVSVSLFSTVVSTNVYKGTCALKLLFDSPWCQNIVKNDAVYSFLCKTFPNISFGTRIGRLTLSMRTVSIGWKSNVFVTGIVAGLEISNILKQYYKGDIASGKLCINKLTNVVGKAGGALGGAFLGAKLGTMILPGWGTFIGAILGSIIGSLIGTALNDKIWELMGEGKDELARCEIIAKARNTLGVKKSTPWNEVVHKYKKLLLIHHPDKNIKSENASKNFIQVHQAFQILKSDHQKKFGKEKTKEELDRPPQLCIDKY